MNRIIDELMGAAVDEPMGLHGWLLSFVIASTATTVWRLDAGGGAVHGIISRH